MDDLGETKHAKKSRNDGYVRFTWLNNMRPAEYEEFKGKCQWATHTGPPFATKEYSSFELEKMGLIGVYRN